MSRYDGMQPMKAVYRGQFIRCTPLRPTPSKSFAFTFHQVSTGERPDTIAAEFIGSSRDWHEIADVNPERLYWGDLAPGDVIRIPRV